MRTKLIKFISAFFSGVCLGVVLNYKLSFALEPGELVLIILMAITSGVGYWFIRED